MITEQQIDKKVSEFIFKVLKSKLSTGDSNLEKLNHILLIYSDADDQQKEVLQRCFSVLSDGVLDIESFLGV
jgi:hypothetical protein